MKKILSVCFGLLAFILSVVLLFAGVLAGGAIGTIFAYIAFFLFVLSGLLLA